MASKVIYTKRFGKTQTFTTNYFVSHRIYSWQVAPQQSLFALQSGNIKLQTAKQNISSF
jgi:hypothetical protein